MPKRSMFSGSGSEADSSCSQSCYVLFGSVIVFQSDRISLLFFNIFPGLLVHPMSEIERLLLDTNPLWPIQLFVFSFLSCRAFSR